MTFYHWLGIDAEPPMADEDAQYIVEDHGGGFTASLIEDDGDITLYPKVPPPPTR